MAMQVQTHNQISGLMEDVGQFVQELLPEEGEADFKGVTTLRVVECETDRERDAQVADDIVTMEEEVRRAGLARDVAAERELERERENWEYKGGYDIFENDCRARGMEEARSRRKGVADQFTLAVERSTEGTIYVCTRPGCGAMRLSEEGMIGHNRSEGDAARTCKKCKKTYRNTNSFLKHLRAHAKKTQVDCPVCGKHCDDSGSLKHHMYVHSITACVTCSVCSLKIYQPGDVKKHFRNVHDNFSPVQDVDYTRLKDEEMQYQTPAQYKKSKKPKRKD